MATAQKKLIVRTPVSLWGRDVRPGDVITTNAETAARLIETTAAEVYADQAIATFDHYEGAGDAFEVSRQMGRTPATKQDDRDDRRTH